MKRDVPRYIEAAAMRMRDKHEYIETLCRLFPDTMRWISYYIDTSLGNMRDEENRKLAALDTKRREQEEAADQRSQEA
jgi:hypothetical protein